MKNVSASKISIILMFLTLIGRLTGLFREMMLSYIYGASVMSDAYVVATTFSSVIFAGLAAAVLNGYVPVAVEANKRNELKRYTDSMMLVTFLMTYLFAIILFLFLHPILSVMAKGFSQDAYNYAYQLSTYVLVFSPLLCLINVLAGYLQIKGNFLASALQSLATNIIMIVVFYTTVGSVDALGMGYGFSVIVPFFIILICAYKEGYIPFGKAKLWDSNILLTWKLILPTLGVQLAAQINSIIDRSFASSLEEGTVSALKYAFLLCTMVVSIIAVSIGMVKFPRLALAFSEKKENEAVNIFTSAMNSVLFIVIPIVFGIILLAKPIIKMLFEHGAFLPSDTERTAMLLQLYAFAILGNSFQEIISRILMAAKKAKALMFLYMGYVVLNVCLNVCFVRVWKANGLAFGTTIATLISVVTMLIYLKTQYKTFEFKEILKPLVKMLCSSMIMVIALIVLKNAMNFDAGEWWNSLINIFVSMFVGVIIYLGGLWILKEETFLTMWNGFVKKGRK